MPVLQSVFVLRSSAVFLMKALCYSDSQSDLSYSMVYWFQYCSRYTVWPNCVICVFFFVFACGLFIPLLRGWLQHVNWPKGNWCIVKPALCVFVCSIILFLISPCDHCMSVLIMDLIVCTCCKYENSRKQYFQNTQLLHILSHSPSFDNI